MSDDWDGITEWDGITLSNFVEIKDYEALQNALNKFPEIEIMRDHNKNMYRIYSDENMFSIMRFCSDDEDEETEQFDPAIHVCPYMKKNQVLIINVVGHDCYLNISASSFAYDSDGNLIDEVWIGDIYESLMKNYPDLEFEEI